MPAFDARLLESAGRKVLEESAFVLLEPGPPSPEPLPVRVAIWIGAPVNAHLVLSTAPAVAQEVAENLLGLEPGSPEARVQGVAALSEVANIVAGVAVADALNGVDCVLGLPRLVEADEARGTPDAVVDFRSLEGEPVRLELFREHRAG